MLCCALCAAPPYAVAQGARGYACPPPAREAAIRVPAPPMGSFALWTVTQAAAGGATRFAAAAPGAQADTTLLLGVSPGMLHLTTVNALGAVVARRTAPVEGLQEVVGAMPNAAGGYAIFGSTTQDTGWMGRMDADGAELKTAPLGPGRVRAAAARPGGSWMVVQDKGQAAAQFALVAPDGQVTQRRSYLAGTAHGVAALAALPDGAILAAGWLEEPNPRAATRPGAPEVLRRGWMAALDAQGGLIWQRPYGPGAFAAAAPLGQRYAVAAGGRGPALRVVVVRADTGGEVWARTLADRGGEWALAPVGAEVDTDAGGVVRVLAAATPGPDAPEGSAPHARLFALSPRGDGLFQAAYHNGSGVEPAALATVPGAAGRSVLLGATRAGYSDAGAAQAKDSGWAVAVPAAPKWDDPCAP